MTKTELLAELMKCEGVKTFTVTPLQFSEIVVQDKETGDFVSDELKDGPRIILDISLT